MKKKFLVAGLTAIMMTMTLVGCQFSSSGPGIGINTDIEPDSIKQQTVNNNDLDVDVDPDVEIDNVDVDVDIEPNVNVEQSIGFTSEQIYQPIINAIAEYVMITDFEPFNTEGFTGIDEVVLYSTDPLEDIGVAIVDLNMDGVDELLVGTGNYYEGDVNIVQLYTIVDDEPVLLLEGWSRSRNYTLNDGTILTEGSSGADYSSFGILKIAGDHTEYDSFYYTTPGGVYFNTTGEETESELELTGLGVDDFMDFEDSYFNEMYVYELTSLKEKSYGVTASEIGSLDWVFADNYDVVDVNATDGATLIELDIVKAMKNFEIYALDDVEITNDGELKFTENTVKSYTELNNKSVIVVRTTVVGDILPAFGFKYNSETGTKNFLVGISGFDGSVYITER